jgi:serine/threonine-protein kinase
MGVVRKVHDPHLRRDLALKVMRASHAGDERARSRFIAEAQLTSQLDHPGIVPVHSIGVGLSQSRRHRSRTSHVTRVAN